MPTKSKAVQAVASQSLDISERLTSAQVLYAIENDLQITIESSATEADIVRRTTEATSAEDVFGSQGELKTPKQVLGTTLRVLAVEGARQSDADKMQGLGIYLVVKVADPDGDTFSMAVGSTDAVVKLLRLEELRALPRYVAFEESKKTTANGRTPINLVDREAAGGF